MVYKKEKYKKALHISFYLLVLLIIFVNVYNLVEYIKEIKKVDMVIINDNTEGEKFQITDIRPGFEKVVTNYINNKGIIAFLDEYYNFFGTKDKTLISSENIELARSLGLRVKVATIDQFSIIIPKTEILSKSVLQNRLKRRRILADFFSDYSNIKELTDTQRLFVEWHFLATDDYQFVLKKPNNNIIIGWNVYDEILNSNDFSIFTFGLVGCTFVFSIASDGNAHFSHWDGEANVDQIKVLNKFLTKHPEAKIYIVGVKAFELGKILRDYHFDNTIFIHKKPETDWERTVYSSTVRRQNNQLLLQYAAVPISENYLHSIYNDEYANIRFPYYYNNKYAYNTWFSLGRFSLILPPEDDAFMEIPFEIYK